MGAAAGGLLIKKMCEMGIAALVWLLCSTLRFEAWKPVRTRVGPEQEVILKFDQSVLVLN